MYCTVTPLYPLARVGSNPYQQGHGYLWRTHGRMEWNRILPLRSDPIRSAWRQSKDRLNKHVLYVSSSWRAHRSGNVRSDRVKHVRVTSVTYMHFKKETLNPYSACNQRDYFFLGFFPVNYELLSLPLLAPANRRAPPSHIDSGRPRPRAPPSSTPPTSRSIPLLVFPRRQLLC